MLKMINGLQCPRSCVWRKPLVARYCSANVQAWKKRKVAIVVGYVGTNYSGVQMMDPAIPTVERELEAALHRVGSISDSNHLHLDKINWSRSSRTDKGVHAARLVISAKLLFPPECIERGNEDFKNFIGLVNKELPSDIRVFSCIRVNQGFYARGSGTWREYEYRFPINMASTADAIVKRNFASTEMNYLTADTPRVWHPSASTPQEFIDRMNEVFKLFEGNRSMHNFHRRKEWKRARKTRAKMKPWVTAACPSSTDGTEGEDNLHMVVDGIDDDDDNDDAEEEVDAVSRDATAPLAHCDYNDMRSADGDKNKQRGDTADESSTNGGNAKQSDWTRFYDNWSPVVNSQVCNDFDSQRPVEEALLKKPQSLSIFLCEASLPSHQSNGDQMATVTVRGQAFLLHQIRMMVGAALLYASGVIPISLIKLALAAPFKMAFPLAPSQGLILITCGFSRNVNKQDYVLTRDVAKKGDLLMASEAENDICMNFLQSTIYPQVAQDWQHDDYFVWRRFFELSRQYVVSARIERKWCDMLERVQMSSAEMHRVRHERGSSRINRCVEEFEVYTQERLRQQGDCTPTMPDNSADRIRKRPFRDFLPNGIQSELVDDTISAALRAVACQVVLRAIPTTLTTVELANHIDETGGIEYWASEERRREAWIM